MPTIAPTSAPSPAEPTAQPIRTPIAIAARRIPSSTPPAAAGWREGRAAGSMRRASISTLVTAETAFLRLIAPTLFRVSEEGLVERRSSSGCDGRSGARTQGAFVSAAIRARLRTRPRGNQRGPTAQQMFRRTLLGDAALLLRPAPP